MDEGFLAPRRTSPTTLGLVILAHAAVLAAVIVAKGPPIRIHGPDIPMIDIAPPSEPPPPIPVQPPRADPRTPASPPARPEASTRTTDLDPIPTVDLGKAPTVPDAPPFGPPVVPEAAHVPVLADPILDPRFARDLQPPYPSSMMRAEIEGRAVVRVLVGVDGRVKAVEIVSADDPAFAEATRRQALGHWRFRPATRDGVPVEAWRTMTVRFRLDA